MAATAGGRQGLLVHHMTSVLNPGSATYHLVTRGSYLTSLSLSVLLWELGLTVTLIPTGCSRTRKWLHVKLVKCE